MFWVYGIVILLSIALGFFLWPKANRSFHLAAVSGLVIGGISMLCIYITQWWPVEHQVVETVVKKYVEPPKIVYKDKIVYRVPDGEVAPVDVRAACTGKVPVEIVQMNVADADKDSRTTWVTGHLVGSKVKFTCGQPGDYSGSWAVGDIVQFIRGTPQ